MKIKTSLIAQPADAALAPFIVTGSGKFFRNVQLDPAANLGVESGQRRRGNVGAQEAVPKS
jgi:hypothetical protein